MPGAIISIIKGGLGNQLFTYAAGRAMALRLGRDYYLDLRRGYTHDGYGRSYRLDHFAIQALEMPEEWRVAPTLKHLRHKAVRSWNKMLPRNSRSYLAQDWSLPATQLTHCKPKAHRVLINGYWQDEAYFADYADTIRAELKPPCPVEARNQKFGELLDEHNTVFVHARRIRYPVLLPADYYRSAIRHVIDKVENPRFVVFSDDHEWSRNHIDFEGHPVERVEHNADDELADFWLMSRCKHAIIANSSFSWWGAWLGTCDPNKRTICAPTHPEWPAPPAIGWHAIPFEARQS